jgi:hypothetical protein
MSTDTDFAAAVAKTGPVGSHRTFGDWASHASQLQQMSSDQAANRLPWISWKAPGGATAAGWREIVDGRHDAALRTRARSYAALTKPAIVTFHHEPSNDGTEAEAAVFAAAWCRIHDVFAAEGALRKIAFPPVYAEFLFSDANAKNPDNWLTDEMLRRVSTTSFLGIDLYQTVNNQGYAQRLGAILAWAAARGYPNLMVGIGETGASAYYGASPEPERWMRDNWTWCARNTSRIGVVSYFNSTANSKPGRIWHLTEASTQKLAEFRSLLRTTTSCYLNTAARV